MREEKTSKLINIGLVITILLVVITLIVFIVMTVMQAMVEEEARDKADEFDREVGQIQTQKELGNQSDENKDNLKFDDPEVKAKGKRIKMEDYDVVGTVRIPKTGVKYPILAPLTARSLEIATAMLDTTSGVNEPGNTTILGHNYRNKKFFSKNHTLKKGDKIYIKDITGREVEYEIYKGFSTTPNDSAYMRRNTNGATEISLSTCSDDNAQRYVLLARKTGEK